MKREEVREANLVENHAYSVIAAKLITLDNGKKEKLIKIRNPWGFFEWNGDWSDKSKKWTEKTKQQVNFVDKEDGTFWISFADYVKFFTYSTICHHLDSFVENTIEDMHD